MGSPRQWKRDGRRNEVAVLQRGPLVIKRVWELRARLDIDDERRATLNQRDLGPARAQILRNIMAAVAGADDENALALPLLTVVVLAGVQDRAAEGPQRRDIGKVRNAADAGGHHDVARTQLPLRAIRAA